jgi:broad specificity phosphatase PhoE
MRKRAKRVLIVSGVLISIHAFGSHAVAGSGAQDWGRLAQGGLVVLIRHAPAPGFGDPPGFRLDDCSTQRNLSEEGRAQARSLGEAFRRRAVPVEKVYSSQWCRCRDTAQLAFGAFQEHPALNSFFEQPERMASQTEDLRALLLQLRPRRGNLVMVTHQVNITALTGVVPSQGELVAVAVDDDGRVEVRLRLMPAD